MRQVLSLFVILLLALGCAGSSRFQSKFDISDKTVGLLVINYWADPEYKSLAVSEFDAKLAEAFKEEIEANTLYRIKQIKPLYMEGFSAPFRGTFFAQDLIGQPRYREEITSIADLERVDFIILIFIEDFEELVGRTEPFVDITVQMIEASTGNCIYQESIKTPFDRHFIYDVVSRFPGFFTPKSGCDPAEKMTWIIPEALDLPSQEGYPEAGAVYLIDEAGVKIHIKPGNIFTSFTKHGNIYTTETRHTAIQILNERGYQYSDVTIPFSEGVDIEYIEARTIAPDGAVIILEEDQIHTVDLFPEYVFFSDVKAKKFTMPGIEPGCIIEYRYQRTFESVALWDTWSFHRQEPMLQSSFSMDIPQGLDYVIHFYCPDHLKDEFCRTVDDIEEWEERGGYREKQTSRVARMTKRYTLGPLPALRTEEDMPPWAEVMPQLKFCSATFGGEPFLTTWDDLSGWYSEFIGNCFHATGHIKDEIRQIVHNAQTDEEKARRLYEFVQKNTRYVAKEFGLGKIIPQEADQVYRQKYGDCKGFSSLLVTMLRFAEIEAYPAILRTKDSGALDKAYVSLDQFDHMIVFALVDSQNVWMDPTVRTCPYGRLPWQDQGVEALVLKKGPEFIATSISSADENLTDRQIEVQSLDDGAIQLSGTISYQGQDGLYMTGLLEVLNRQQQEKVLRNYISGSYPNAQAIVCSCSTLDKQKGAVEIDFSCQVPHFFTRVDNKLVIRPGQLTARVSHPYSQERIYPLVFDYQRCSRENVTFKIPEGYAVKESPQPAFISTDFGEYRAEVQSNEEALFYTRECFQTMERVSCEDIAAYMRFREQVTSSDQVQVVLEKKL